MSLLTSTASLLLVALLATAGWVLSQPTGSPLQGDLERSREAMLATIPDPAARTRIRARALAVGDALGPLLAQRLGGRRLDPRPATQAVVVRATLALSILPISGVLSTIAAIWGLLRRRRLMDGHGFHSLTFSYLGKILTAGSWGAFAYSGLSPLAPPLWTLYLFSALGAGGGALYLRNLPPKL
jgi:hypothetical protein